MRTSILHDESAAIAHYQSPQITTSRRGYLWSSLIFDALCTAKKSKSIEEAMQLEQA